MSRVNEDAQEQVAAADCFEYLRTEATGEC